MIPHVLFLLRDGLKAYFGWISQVLRSKHVPQLCKNMSFFNHIKEVIYSLPQALFRKRNVQTIMENIRFSRKNMKNHETCHLFFAAGAFSQKDVQPIMKHMRISKKT